MPARTRFPPRRRRGTTVAPPTCAITRMAAVEPAGTLVQRTGERAQDPRERRPQASVLPVEEASRLRRLIAAGIEDIPGQPHPRTDGSAEQPNDDARRS